MKKIAQMKLNLLFGKNIHFCVLKTAKRKQPPNRLKFAQSGHPVNERKLVEYVIFYLVSKCHTKIHEKFSDHDRYSS
jgi:hypothetical protein